jgi:hypothetical protein
MATTAIAVTNRIDFCPTRNPDTGARESDLSVIERMNMWENSGQGTITSRTEFNPPAGAVANNGSVNSLWLELGTVDDTYTSQKEVNPIVQVSDVYYLEGEGQNGRSSGISRTKTYDRYYQLYLRCYSIWYTSPTIDYPNYYQSDNMIINSISGVEIASSPAFFLTIVLSALATLA